MSQSGKNWFMVQEHKWRTLASAFWTWLLSFPVIGSFLLVWIFSPFYFVTNLCDYFTLLLSIRSWLLVLCMSLLSSVTVLLHLKNYSVTCSLEFTRFELLFKYVHLRNLFFASCYAVLCGLNCLLIGSFSTSQLSVFIDCNNPSGTFRCFNESYFIFVLFGVTLGFFNYVICKTSHFYTLKFSTQQQCRYVSLKCNFTNLLVESGRFSLSFLKYFMVVYYLFGLVPRGFLSVISGYPICDGYVVSIHNVVGVLSLGWTLWITGTFLLLLQALSWHMFNIYTTQMYSFPVDSVFPEDNIKLLSENLTNKQPLLVQHLAFQHLNSISKYSHNKRAQLFAIKYEKNGKRSLKWDKVADECISRINELIANLKSKSEDRQSSTSSASRSEPCVSSNTESSPPISSVSTLRRRPLSDATNASIVNASYFEVSPVKASVPGAQHNAFDSSATLNESAITVPAPKWWTRQYLKKRRSIEKTPYVIIQKTANLNAPSPTVQKCDKSNKNMESFQQPPIQVASTQSKFVNMLKKIPLVSYFVAKIQSHVAANLFSNYIIYKCAIESISLLAAASFTEDECGFVQKRLQEIIVTLLELFLVLERNCKLVMTSSTSSALPLLRQQYGLKAATKSAIYRITDTFSKYMDAMQLCAEHRRKLKSFLCHNE